MAYYHSWMTVNMVSTEARPTLWSSEVINGVWLISVSKWLKEDLEWELNSSCNPSVMKCWMHPREKFSSCLQQNRNECLWCDNY